MTIDDKIREAHEIDIRVLDAFQLWSDQMWEEFDQTTAARPEKGQVVTISLYGLIVKTKVAFVCPDGDSFMIWTRTGCEKVGMHQIVPE